MTKDNASPRPVLIEMRDLQKSLSLDMLMAQHFVRVPDVRIPVDAFRYVLSEGKAALLFDGFDELAFRLSYDNVRQHFETVIAAAEGNSKIVVTSRTAHFLNDQDIELALGREARRAVGYRLVKLASFDRQRIRQALVKRLGDEDEASDRERLLDGVEDLMELSSNPRMLSFILDTFTPDELREVGASHGKLTRSGIYHRLVKRWLGAEVERASPKGAEPPLSEAQLWRAVTDFALLLWPRSAKGLRMKDVPEALWRGIAALDPLGNADTEEVKVNVGSRSLLVRDDEGRFYFLHQSILEWLVARDAANELAAGGTAVMLERRNISPLMASFLVEMANPSDLAVWTRRALAQGGEAAQNAMVLLQKSGSLMEEDGQVGFRVDLHEQDLSRRDFSGTSYLRGADLRRANLSRATLVDAELAGATLAGANLSHADLRRASLKNALLNGVRAVGADLRKANLKGATLVEADLRNARLLGADVDPQALLTAAERLGATGISAHCAHPRTMPGHYRGATASFDFQVNGRVLRWIYGGGMELWMLPECRLGWKKDGLESSSNDSNALGDQSLSALRDGDVARTTDGRFAAKLERGALRVWQDDASRGTSLLRAEGSDILCATFHPSKPYLASGGADGTIRLWDIRRALHWQEEDVLFATMMATPDGWVAFVSEGRYKVHGDVRGFFWHEVNGVRFEAGELDDDLDAFDIPPRRVPLDEPLFEMPE